MFKSLGSMIVGIGLAIGLLPGPASAEDARATPDLTGVWTGKVEAGVSEGTQGHEPKVHEPTFGNYDLVFTLTVEEQNGRAVTGTWASEGHSEDILGVVRRDNKSVILVDEDSYFSGDLLSPTSMELCLAESHLHAMGVWCLMMEKQAEE